MPIPKVLRSAYRGRTDLRDNSLPERCQYMYCNCGSGLDGRIVLLSTDEPIRTQFGSLYARDWRRMALVDMLPIVTNKHQRMCVEVV